jgi:uncharacterized protein (DUF2141 family)
VKRAAALAAGVALATAAPALAGTLTVDVTNVRNAKGVVHIDVCPQAKFLKDDCPYAAEAPARPGLTTVVIHNLPAGTYALQAFHDENDNHKVDRALFGIPKEGIGFSNDAPIHLSPPKWKDAALAFNGGNRTTTLKMRYMLGASGPKD